MKNADQVFIILALCLLSTQPVIAQGRGGFDPQAMAAREKNMLFKKIEDLSEDQKMLMGGIYQEDGDSFMEIREEVRKTRNWQEMRPKMMALREEKTLLMKDLLNPPQFEIYADLMTQQEKQFRERQQERQNGPPNPVNK